MCYGNIFGRSKSIFLYYPQTNQRVTDQVFITVTMVTSHNYFSFAANQRATVLLSWQQRSTIQMTETDQLIKAFWAKKVGVRPMAPYQWDWQRAAVGSFRASNVQKVY